MSVKLVSVSQPVVDGIQTAEDLMVYCARVSNPSNQLNTATGASLLAYCIRHGHWSVFETASMTVEITTSRAIAAQILRHKSFSFQEFSQRYSEAPSVEQVELRQQAEKNRQSSTEVMPKRGFAAMVMRQALASAQKAYQDLLEQGVARECARMVLPLATTTTLYMTGSVRSWIHYLAQRLDEHTQKEHRIIAEQVQSIFAAQFPVVNQALKDHGTR